MKIEYNNQVLYEGNDSEKTLKVNDKYCVDDIKVTASVDGFPIHITITEQNGEGNYLIIDDVATDMGSANSYATNFGCKATKVKTEINDYASDTDLRYRPTGTSTWLAFPLNTEMEITQETDFIMRFGSCLLKGTKILMADGTQRNIEDLYVGDIVQGYYGDEEITNIDSAYKKYNEWYDEWIFDDGTILKTTHQHQFYNSTLGKYAYMKKYNGEDDCGHDEWSIGDKGLKHDGSKPTLINHIHHEELCQHYTLFTNDNTYYANGMLCGNRKSVKIGGNNA